MLFMSGSGDLMAFRLQDSSFHYEIRLAGEAVNEVQSFQGCFSSAHDAHLCILDSAKNLSYYQWKGIKWQQICSWQQVAPCFQSALDHLGRFHLILSTQEGSRYYRYSHHKEQETDLPFLAPEHLLLELYPVNEDCLLLFQKETSESSCHISYYSYHCSSHSWSAKLPFFNPPPDCRQLQFFLSQGRIYLTYLTPAGNSDLLQMLFLDSSSGEIVEHCFGKLSTVGGLPVMSKLEENLVLLVLEPKNLTFWRSGDGGQTWTTKWELPCPWPLELAPALNPQKEITDYIALEGFYGLELQQPALLTTRQLLSLSPYGLWF